MQLLQALTCYGAWTPSGKRKAYIGEVRRCTTRTQGLSFVYAEGVDAEAMSMRVEIPASFGKAERLHMQCLAAETEQSVVSSPMWGILDVAHAEPGSRYYLLGVLPTHGTRDSQRELRWGQFEFWDQLPRRLETGWPHLEHQATTPGEAALSTFVQALHIAHAAAGPRNDPPTRAVGVEPCSREQHPSTLWRSVNDKNASIEQRCDALFELLSLDQERAKNYIVTELCKDDLASSWRNSLILIVEDVQINDARLRRRLIDRLFVLAQSLRRSTEAAITPIVHSAIRSYASMIDLREAGCLAAFLEPPKPVETRLVTLLCVINLFASRPLDQGGDEAFQDRVHELAIKFLDRDWLAPGEKAAIGQNALVALAAMGDARVAECTKIIKGLAMPWLTRQVTPKLEGLLANWSHDSSLAHHPATSLVQDQLKALGG